MSKKIEHVRVLLHKGLVDEATSISEELLRVLPEHYESTCLFGEITARRGDVKQALSVFGRAIKLKPDQSLAYYKRANVLKDSNRLEDSLADYDRAIARNPSFAHAICNQGVVFQRMERLQEALESYCRAIELDPTDAFSLFNRGDVLRKLNKSDEALKSYAQAIQVRPDYTQCYCNLGLLQAELHDYQASLRSYDRCIEIDSEFPTAHFNRAVLLQMQKNWNEALFSYGRVIEMKPDHVEAYKNRGKLFMELGEMEAALNDFDQAVQLRPNCAETYFNRGNLLARIGSYSKAIENYDKAIAVMPDYPDTYYNRADTLLQMRRFAAAADSYDEAYRQNPNRAYLQGMRLYARLNLCCWDNFDQDAEKVIDAVETEPSISPPFPLLALVDQPELQFKCAQSWARNQCSIEGIPSAFVKQEKGGKIRIGYFSGDFHTHPVSMLLASVIENHDRTEFEVFAFSYGPNVDDDMRRRMKAAFDQFVEIGDMLDQDAASMARNMGIDIAVDLAGYTGNGRSKIFAWRAAPLQLNFLGCPGTMGASFIDYIVGDGTVIPAELRRNYLEKVITLPICFMPLDAPRNLSRIGFSKERSGLPASGFVFCCFNNSYKINPGVFDSWSRIMRRAPDSVLWLSRHSDTAAANLRRKAAQRGVDPDRVIFAERVTSHAEHLGRHQMADVFLDTYPYNAHATAADALCAGLPIITVAGKSFAARVTTSLLTACGLEQLISASPGEYEDLAVNLASDPQRMIYLKTSLVHSLKANSLDTQSFTKSLEAAYRRIADRYRGGLQPEHIDIQRDA